MPNQLDIEVESLKAIIRSMAVTLKAIEGAYYVGVPKTIPAMVNLQLNDRKIKEIIDEITD